jgi:hypothetical protein
MRRTLATALGIVALAILSCSCGKGSAPTEQHPERQGASQAETTAHETSTPTRTSRGVSAGERAARSEADCRLVLYVADQDMSRKEAEAFSKLLTEMIRTMESLSWPEGQLRNAALDHRAVPRYRECKGGEE